MLGICLLGFLPINGSLYVAAFVVKVKHSISILEGRGSA